MPRRVGTRPPPRAVPPPQANPAADAEPLPADAVEVGRVLGAWGVKGGLKVKPLSADPQALFSSRRWFIAPPVVPRPAAPAALPRLLRVTGAREHGETVVATCQELSDRDAAQALAGARVLVSRASFPTPDANEYYWVDLIGLDVVARDGLRLGRVAGLVETGPHCVLRVASDQADDADEVLIPFVDAYVDRVDLAGRAIHVDWHRDY